MLASLGYSSLGELTAAALPEGTATTAQGEHRSVELSFQAAADSRVSTRGLPITRRSGPRAEGPRLGLGAER